MLGWLQVGSILPEEMLAFQTAKHSLQFHFSSLCFLKIDGTQKLVHGFKIGLACGCMPEWVLARSWRPMHMSMTKIERVPMREWPGTPGWARQPSMMKGTMQAAENSESCICSAAPEQNRTSADPRIRDRPQRRNHPP